MRRNNKTSVFVYQPKESDICISFYHQIQALKNINFFAKEFVLFHIANEQNTNVRYTMHLKKMGLLAGAPDYCCIAENGSVCFLEFKRNAKCKLTESQKAFQGRCIKFKIPYFIAYTEQEGINFLLSVLK
jgi:hypothetical protein